MKRIFAARRIVLPAAIYGALLTAVRNAVTARMLGPEQFGLAAMFLLMQQFIDLITETSLNRFLLQNRMGNRPSVQAMVHAIAAARGLIVTALLLAIAWPVFKALDLATSVTPFLLLAAMSLSMGLLHYDNARLQRRNTFANDSLSAMVGETCAFLAVLVALIFTRNYLVALIAVAVRAAAVTITSHTLARRRYIIRYSATIAPALMAFSWPLFINGPLLFVSSQADRLLVSSLLGAHELGIYSAALLLLYLPLTLLMRVVGTVFAPRLAEAHRAGTMKTVETEFAGALFTINMAAACGFAAVGPTALVLMYGPAFALHTLPVALIGLVHCVRSIRTWPVGIALAIGRTDNILTSTVLRLIALPLGIAGILLGGGISGMTTGLLLGEAMTLVLNLILLNRNRGLPLNHGLEIVAIALGVAVLLPSALWLLDPAPLLAAGIAVATLAAALTTAHLVNRRLVPRNLAALGW